jgi:hypothetical protein
MCLRAVQEPKERQLQFENWWNKMLYDFKRNNLSVSIADYI